MTVCEPSLFRLFSRSRYRTVLPNGGGNEGLAETEIRSERERFATAAVAFCLKHSPTFRQHFWKTICRGEADPAEIPELTVDLEPHAWADLRVVDEVGTHRTVWVIEFKLDSELADKQNPTELSAFVEPDVGYGAQFRASEIPGSDLRYVVLGSQKLPAGKGFVAGLNISWHARRWRDLVEGAVPEDALTADLFDSLGQLGIAAFRMKTTKTIAVAGDFRAAADAWEVLTAVGSAEQCGFRPTYWNLAVETPADGHFNVGAYLKPPPAKKASSVIHHRLAQAIGGTGGNLAWAGYETGASIPDRFRRSIWFYCATIAQADSLRQRLVGRATTGDPISESGGMCVIASKLPGDTTKDLEWFSSVFSAAAK